jgi:hypothetical protein
MQLVFKATAASADYAGGQQPLGRRMGMVFGDAVVIACEQSASSTEHCRRGN